jgi:hypothetical protein
MSVRSDAQNIIDARNREIKKLREENQRIKRCEVETIQSVARVRNQAKIEVLREVEREVDKLRDGEGVSIEHAYELTVSAIRKQLEGE